MTIKDANRNALLCRSGFVLNKEQKPYVPPMEEGSRCSFACSSLTVGSADGCSVIEDSGFSRKGSRLMILRNVERPATAPVPRELLLVAASLLGVLPLGAPVWAQRETTRDNGLTLARQDSKAVGEAKPSAKLEQAPCDGANYETDAFNDSVLMGGPIVGFAWTPGATLTISRIEVFTGESTGPVALAIWSDDSPNVKPLANLSNTPYFPLNPANSWQGADLLAPVTVNAGTRYWVVFDPVRGEQAPVQNGVGQTYWGSSVGTIT